MQVRNFLSCYSLFLCFHLSHISIAYNKYCNYINSITQHRHIACTIFNQESCFSFKIGLVDLLKSINVTPDHVIGYSIGELCCGYVTDNFTIEQVILSAYYIGLTLNESKIIRGAMMNVPLGYKEAKGTCPSDIDVSSFNVNVCCLSGPKTSVKSLATQLQVLYFLC